MAESDRTLRARIAAHEMHARHDSRRTTQAARDAAFGRFERQVDPDGVLEPAERARRARHAQSAHMSRISRRRWGSEETR